MSTQSHSGFEFSILPEEDQEHFRLLELPPELLNIVTSKNPPRLQLKSRESSGGDASTVLCTPSKTYNLRQVSTSNTVFLARNSFLAGGIPQSELQAIAQSHSTLEVLPTINSSAIPYITTALPAYTSTGHYLSKDAISKRKLFNDIPLSDAECEVGWRELMCFELGEARHGVIPTNSLKLKTWTSLLQAARAMDVNLTERLDESSRAKLIDPGDDWPDELSEAILRSMTASSPDSNEIHLHDQTCARIVGRILLKDSTDGLKDSITVAAFKSAWGDLLPEKWRDLADIALLDGCCSLEDGGSNIRYVDNSANVIAADGVVPNDAKSTLGAKRKWHEKFRASKKAS